jgi:UDP-N-acetylmuramoyl-tripeptide--D-alanyl-D-alanine ligase
VRLRASGSPSLLAIGGAAGKTTTKELAAAAARALFQSAFATPGNLNNRIGVPMTLLALEPEHRAAIIECGTNLRGEIPALARIVEPDVAMVLNVDVEHSEGLGTLEQIADEECALFSTARRAAVACADEPLVLARVPASLRLITFGASAADVRLVARAPLDGARALVTLDLSAALVARRAPRRLSFELAIPGPSSALNAAAAVAAVAALADAPLDAPALDSIARALARVAPVAGRLATLDIRGIFVLDDTYNANPRSVRSSLAAARELADRTNARLVVALGDMLELGELAAAAHADAVRDVLDARPAAFLAVGPEMSAAARAHDSPASCRPLVARDSDEAAAHILSLVRAGDVLLIKGSRGLRMERILSALRSS